MRVTTGESGLESLRGLGAITANRLMMSATCWQNVSGDSCGRCLDTAGCRPPAAFHVLFRASGVAGDDHDGSGCPPSADGDLRLMRGVGVCERLTAGRWFCCCCCCWCWYCWYWCCCATERFRRNGDCCGEPAADSLPPAERLRGGRVTGGVPGAKTTFSRLNQRYITRRAVYSSQLVHFQ